MCVESKVSNYKAKIAMNNDKINFKNNYESSVVKIIYFNCNDVIIVSGNSQIPEDKEEP